MDLCSIKNLSLKDKDFQDFISKTKKDYPSKVLDISTIEQLRLRMYICQECFTELKCKKCGCNPYDTFVENYSCNQGEYFPNLMNKWKWEEFKEKHNLIFK